MKDGSILLRSLDVGKAIAEVRYVEDPNDACTSL